MCIFIIPRAQYHGSASIIINYKDTQAVMDIENMNQTQLDLVFRICDMLGIKDMGLGAALLEENQWQIENVINQVIDQQLEAEPLPNQNRQPRTHPIYYDSLEDQIEEQNRREQFNEILAQQNLEYEQLMNQMVEEKEEEVRKEQTIAEKEKDYATEVAFFANKTVTDPFTIRIRLAKKNESYTFCKNDTIEIIFKYVSCSLREYFENRHADFELVQSGVGSGLAERKGELIGKVFGESEGVVLNVKEIY